MAQQKENNESVGAVLGTAIAEGTQVFRGASFYTQIFPVFLAGTFISQAAADKLPYRTRTHAYSGWNATVGGDVRTIGMAGATVGLADTFLAAADNPADCQ